MVLFLSDTARQTANRPGLLDFQREAAEFEARKRQRQMQEQMMPLEMQKAQLEAEFMRKKLNAAPEFDLNQTTQNALMKYNMGQELTPQEMAAIKTSVMLNPAKTQYQADESGRVMAVTTPNPLQTVLSGMGGGYRTPGINPDPMAAHMAARQSRQAEIGSSPVQGDFIPVDMTQEDIEAQLRGTPFDMQQIGGMSIDPYYMTGPKAQSAAGVEAMKGAADIMTARGMLPIEQEKLKMQTEEELRKEDLIAKRNKPKEINAAERSFTAALQDAQNINSVLDQTIQNVDATTSGFMGSMMSNIPGSPAVDLRENIKTIEADAAFTRLQEMREASKTGGALGAISERELSLLASARAALSPEQSPAQLRANLIRYKQVRQNALKNVAEAFKQDYGYYPQGFEVFAAPQNQDINKLIEFYTQ